MAGVTLKWKPAKVLAMAADATEELMAGLTTQAAQRARSKAKGRIARSVGSTVVKKGNDVTGYVFTRSFVGRLHETGTSKMRARPFLRPAVYETRLR